MVSSLLPYLTAGNKLDCGSHCSSFSNNQQTGNTCVIVNSNNEYNSGGENISIYKFNDVHQDGKERVDGYSLEWVCPDVEDYVLKLIDAELVEPNVIRLDYPRVPSFVRQNPKALVAAEKKKGHFKANIELARTTQRADFTNRPASLKKSHYIIFEPSPNLAIVSDARSSSLGKLQIIYAAVPRTFKITSENKDPRTKRGRPEIKQEVKRIHDMLTFRVFVENSSKPLEAQDECNAAEQVADFMLGKSA